MQRLIGGVAEGITKQAIQAGSPGYGGRVLAVPPAAPHLGAPWAATVKSIVAYVSFTSYTMKSIVAYTVKSIAAYH